MTPHTIRQTVLFADLFQKPLVAASKAPAAEVETQYRPVDGNNAGLALWLGTWPIGSSGRSGELPRDGTFTELLQAFPRFAGFEFRLKDDTGATARCTWQFDGGQQPSTPTVRLSASPNPVTEGSSVTVTARLSAALGSSVTIPLTLTDGTAESADYGTLSAITINAGSTSGTGTVTTNQDTGEDDETFTVALGSLPSSVTAGNPSWVRVTISDDDGGGGSTESSDASLSGLTISAGDLAFDSATTSYAVDVAHDVSSVTVTPTANDDGATVRVNGTIVASSEASATITLEVGENAIEVVVTAEDGTTRTYTVTVTRAALPAELPATLTLSNDPDPAEGGGEVTVTATLDEPAPADGTTVTLTAGSTATLDTDYTLSSSTITIAEGERRGRRRCTSQSGTPPSACIGRTGSCAPSSWPTADGHHEIDRTAPDALPRQQRRDRHRVPVQLRRLPPAAVEGGPDQPSGDAECARQHHHAGEPRARRGAFGLPPQGVHHQ